jgi:hypothetical protein
LNTEEEEEEEEEEEDEEEEDEEEDQDCPSRERCLFCDTNFNHLLASLSWESIISLFLVCMTGHVLDLCKRTMLSSFDGL